MIKEDRSLLAAAQHVSVDTMSEERAVESTEMALGVSEAILIALRNSKERDTTIGVLNTQKAATSIVQAALEVMTLIQLLASEVTGVEMKASGERITGPTKEMMRVVEEIFIVQ